MKETGIIISGNHPRLILDGIKTQTRRVMKPQPALICDYELWVWQRANYWNKSFAQETWLINQRPLSVIQYCPYGQVGSRLWVRETWATEWMLDDFKPSELPKYSPYNPDELLPIAFTDTDWSGYRVGKTRPSIFLPRIHSRITLEITEVRVERVKEINYWDAGKEGFNALPEWMRLAHFHELWDSLNAKRGYGWEVNPWVWVISFKVVNNG